MADEPFFLEPFIRNVPAWSLIVPRTKQYLNVSGSRTGPSVNAFTVPRGYRAQVLQISVFCPPIAAGTSLQVALNDGSVNYIVFGKFEAGQEVNYNAYFTEGEMTTPISQNDLLSLNFFDTGTNPYSYNVVYEIIP